MLLSLEGSARSADGLGPRDPDAQASGRARGPGPDPCGAIAVLVTPGAAGAGAPYLENCIVAKVCSTSRYEGHAVDALAPGAEEGRGRLR
jgi:hypothetical protein